MKKNWPKVTKTLQKNTFIIYSVLVLFISFFIFFFNYNLPQAPYWDENFHIAASQKYLDGVFFVELHPPLGKMLIAAGEALWKPNENLDKSAFNTVDYVESFPDGYSFLGVRFFPALLAFLSGYLFFLLIYILGKNSHLAFIFSSLYLFNNPLIVHFRGAMLDGIQIFFILGSLCYFAHLFWKSKIRWFEFGMLGLLVGLAVSTKINSLILVLLFPFLYLIVNWEKFKKPILNWWGILKKGFLQGSAFILGIAMIWSVVQYIHVGVSQRILDENKPYNGYELSQGYNKIVDNKSFWNPLNIYTTTVGWYEYQTKYNEGVPELDVTKDDENGSYPTNWIVGRKAISYRWVRYPIQKEKHNTYMPWTAKEEYKIPLEDHSNLSDEDKQNYVVAVRYLYLQVNPVIWFFSIVGVVLSLVILLGWLVFGLKIGNWKLLSLIGFFTIMYTSYMITVMRVSRVLYLYHYFVPLIFALLLVFLVFNYRFEQDFQDKKKRKFIYIGLVASYVLILAAFIFYAPFTYYLPLSEQEFQWRNWFDFWGLESV